MRNFKTRLSLLLAIVLLISAFTGWTAFADSLGDKLYGKSLLIGEKTRLANGIYWNAGYTEKIAENYIEYYPGGEVIPVISHGNDVYGAASFKAVVEKAAGEGKYVIAGMNGDYFDMSTGVPIGMTIKDGLLVTSESMSYPTVGFYDDGTAIIGRANLNIRIDSPYLSSPIGSIHLNKTVTKASGVVLYTRVFGNDYTNKATIPTYNILLSVDSEELRLNGTVEATVDSVLNATGPTFIPPGKLLLTMASETNYPGTLANLTRLVPGDPVTITFPADPAWDDVAFAVGGGEKLITAGVNVAPSNGEIHPRTAIGIRADGSVVFYTVDGRLTGHSKGATLSQLANRLLELGCVEAVNMDGGGSTAIHSLYPGDSSLTTVNSPSQGSLRSCANYILLVNTASPTGRLANIHLYPYSVRMLAGATQIFSVKATDENYYPVEAPALTSLTFSASNGIGTFDENNAFTAGASAKAGQITAKLSSNTVATAEVTVVAKPDSITIANQTDGKAVTEITVNSGETVDLTASAVHQRLPLVSQDKCYTWSVGGGIGTIDENGRFTAANITSGAGTITASAGGTSATINVRITSDGWRLETFENSTHVFQMQPEPGISVNLNTDLTKVRYGYQSAEVRYDFAAAAKSELLIPSSLTFTKKTGSLSLWVYGDGSGNTLNLIVNTPEGVKEIIGTKLDFMGWKQVHVNLPAGATALASMKILATGKQTGTFYLDQVMGGLGYYVDLEPPQIQMSVSGGTLTAIVSDGVDVGIAAADMVLTYDGKPLQFQYNGNTRTLTAALPPADGAMHRVALMASDESGNLSRSSLTIPGDPAAPQPFIDMQGHWAKDNTVFLYGQGVVNGVKTDSGLVYHPDKSITRAEFAVLMRNWMGEKAAGYEHVVLPFVDAADIPAWALESVKAMYGMGIIMGTAKDGKVYFNPMGAISRQEVMTIIGRTQVRGFAEADLTVFADHSQIADWALPYVKTLVKQQVVSGYSGKVWPKDPVTRAQVATIITGLY
ncbi:MAG: phosphodiester glycosidase family protein [Anaerovoracaceae bacterium]|jgi:hypothetical protein